MAQLAGHPNARSFRSVARATRHAESAITSSCLDKGVFSSRAHNVPEFRRQSGCPFGLAFQVSLPEPTERRPV
jgi:hypothetical protein